MDERAAEARQAIETVLGELAVLAETLENAAARFEHIRDHSANLVGSLEGAPDKEEILARVEALEERLGNVLERF